MEGIETFLSGALQGMFSVAVAAFLLVRMEGELKALRKAIERLQHCQRCLMSPFLPDADWSQLPERWSGENSDDNS